MTTQQELRKQAQEIAAAGHAGWGNTMRDAANDIDRQEAEIARLTAQVEQYKADADHKEAVVKLWLRANAPGGWIDDYRAALAKAGQDRDALQAKLTALEGQEPVGTFEQGPHSCIGFIRNAVGPQRIFNGGKLYAAAGAAPSIAKAIHYPECWDTAAYPTVESALHEMTAEFQCANDHCAHLATTRVAPMTQDRAEALAHRRCKRYIMIDDAPYQFDAHTLMDFVRDVEKAGAAPVPAGWQLVPVNATPEMVAAYLSANADYWVKTDELPLRPDRWRTGTPADATAYSYKSMLAAAPRSAS